eukprot:3919642-Pyramimonas_sp.AAC.1
MEEGEEEGAAEEDEEGEEEGGGPIHRRRSPAHAGTPRGVTRRISGLVYVRSILAQAVRARAGFARVEATPIQADMYPSTIDYQVECSFFPTYGVANAGCGRMFCVAEMQWFNGVQGACPECHEARMDALEHRAELDVNVEPDLDDGQGSLLDAPTLQLHGGGPRTPPSALEPGSPPMSVGSSSAADVVSPPERMMMMSAGSGSRTPPRSLAASLALDSPLRSPRRNYSIAADGR